MFRGKEKMTVTYTSMGEKGKIKYVSDGKLHIGNVDKLHCETYDNRNMISGEMSGILTEYKHYDPKSLKLNKEIKADKLPLTDSEINDLFKGLIMEMTLIKDEKVLPKEKVSVEISDIEVRLPLKSWFKTETKDHTLNFTDFNFKAIIQDQKSRSLISCTSK